MILQVKKKKKDNRLAKRALHLAKRGASMAGGLRATQGHLKLWGKWCKILHSSLFLASHLLPKILDFFFYGHF